MCETGLLIAFLVTVFIFAGYAIAFYRAPSGKEIPGVGFVYTCPVCGEIVGKAGRCEECNEAT